MTDDLPNWYVHQPVAGNHRARVCGFQAPETAIELADALVGQVGLRTEPDAGTGAFLPSDDALRAGPQDFTRRVARGR